MHKMWRRPTLDVYLLITTTPLSAENEIAGTCRKATQNERRVSRKDRMLDGRHGRMESSRRTVSVESRKPIPSASFQ